VNRKIIKICASNIQALLFTGKNGQKTALLIQESVWWVYYYGSRMALWLCKTF